MRGILLTTWIDLLSRLLLLLTVKSMAINIHLLFTTQCPVISRNGFEHCFPNRNYRFWSVPKAQVGVQLASWLSQATESSTKRYFSKHTSISPALYHKASIVPVSQAWKTTLEKWGATTEASISPERANTDREDQWGREAKCGYSLARNWLRAR